MLYPQLTDSLPRDQVYKVYAGLREEYSHRGQRVLPTRDIALPAAWCGTTSSAAQPGKNPEDAGWVCAGEDKFIKVFKKEADLLMDTSFSYEICRRLPLLSPLAGELPENHPNAERLNALAGCFSLVEPLSLDLVPEHSMLREFLG